MTVYSIFSSPESVISSHAWFPFRWWWHFAFHPQPFHKVPRNPMYQKQMSKRTQNEDFWLKCLVPPIINRKELINFIISTIRRHLKGAFLGASHQGLLPICGSECPLWWWSYKLAINCYSYSMVGFTEILDAIILLLPQLSPAAVCGCFQASFSTYLSMWGHVRLSSYT